MILIGIISLSETAKKMQHLSSQRKCDPRSQDRCREHNSKGGIICKKRDTLFVALVLSVAVFHASVLTVTSAELRVHD